MRVLVACEFSGIVRDAFIAAGHDAVSADLIDTEATGPHIRGDIHDLLWRPSGEPTAFAETIDLLIAHPPCTYLANSGVRWLYGGRGTERDPDRWDRMVDAAATFASLLHHPAIPRIAVENPIMHRHARTVIGPHDTIQTVQPWQFGHGETKATQLWLVNLPPLVPTDVVDGRAPRVHHAAPGPDRWKERSRTLPGIAAAMADQWGALRG
jgi:hypothetical protein